MHPFTALTDLGPDLRFLVLHIMDKGKLYMLSMNNLATQSIELAIRL